jgi:hypothetical protein
MVEAEAALASWIKRWRASSSRVSSGGRNFSATGRSSRLSIAL